MKDGLFLFNEILWKRHKSWWWERDKRLLWLRGLNPWWERSIHHFLYHGSVCAHTDSSRFLYFVGVFNAFRFLRCFFWWIYLCFIILQLFRSNSDSLWTCTPLFMVFWRVLAWIFILLLLLVFHDIPLGIPLFVWRRVIWLIHC